METLTGGLDGCILPVNASCRLMPVTPTEILTKTLLYSVAVITVMFNLLVVISIFHFRQLHTPTNLLILSLAVSDVLVGIIMMPFLITNMFSCWFVAPLLCAIANLFSFVLTSASVGNMVLISVDRYVAICDPLRYSSMITSDRVIICLSLCWICSVLYSILILKDYFIQTDISIYCSQDCSLEIYFISGLVDFVLTFIAPVTVITVLSLRVFLVAVSQARITQPRTASDQSATVAVKKSELRAARTLGIVLLVFIICLCPYFCASVAGEDSVSVSSSVQVWLFYINSSINPLIYAFFYPWFRKALKLIVSLQILEPGSCDTNMMQK